MATIVIFASSLSIASILILVKTMELKHEKRNIILEFISRLDSKSYQIVADLKFRGLQLIQSIRYIILVQSKVFFKNLLKKTEEKIMNEYKKRQDMMMGKKDIDNKGSVSFYLKKITEDKCNGEKGKIE